MKKSLLFTVLCLCPVISFAQNPTYQEKLYCTGKVWGFVKYYHSRVSNCQVNWDSALIHTLPLIKNAVTNNDFNNALDTLLQAAGPMAIASSSFPDNLPAELKRNRNFSWMNDPVFRSDVKTILDTIKNNFRPHPICWVKNNDGSTSNIGWLLFPHDNPMTMDTIHKHYPDESHRLLLFFKYWNILNYFNPYNYVLDMPWDSSLSKYVLSFANAQNEKEFVTALEKISTNLNDVHVEGLTYSYYESIFYDGYYAPKIKVKYIPGKYVVVKSGISGIEKGDEIVNVGGLTPSEWEDSLRHYISAGNISVFRRDAVNYFFMGTPNSTVTVNLKDSLGAEHSFSLTRNTYLYSSFFFDYYPNDTLANVTWKKWDCNIGYVNMGILETQDVNAMYSALKNTKAIIFDIRNYPNGTAWSIANLMYPNVKHFAKDMIPDVTYPGTFSWEYDDLGYNGNANYYKGKIIILMNEETQSQAEYSCMILDAMPDVIKVGSQTAAADGNITTFNISKDISAGFTTLGIFYPNGDSTQRIGIVPDSIIYPTQVGIRHGRDEVLDKALQIAGCFPVSVPSVESSAQPVINIYPNPVTDRMYVEVLNINTEKIIMELMDITGRKIFAKQFSGTRSEIVAGFNLQSLPPGMYILSIKSNTQQHTSKIIRQ